MYLDNNQQGFPQLLTLEKKSNTPSRISKNNFEDKYRPKLEQTKNIIIEIQQQNQRDNSARTEVKSKPIVVDDDKQRTYKKTNEISKNLINETMNKISIKTLAQENYPINNETAQKLLISLEEQVKGLKIQLSKFQNSLLLNPTNQHLKKEKEAVEKKLNQIQTIKQLYNDKIESRRKISQLQSKIIGLKNENRQLKIKIARGIEKIESHIHNLPCQRQKELIEEVYKYKEALDREKEMRMNLELNIQNINLNFKRFYQEAEEARRIVHQQLKEINKKEIQIMAKQEKFKNHKCELKTEDKSLKGDNVFGTSLSYGRKMTSKISDEQNIVEIISQINVSELEDLRRNRANSIKVPSSILGKPKNIEVSSIGGVNTATNEKKIKFNLQEQIQRMRMNQTQFANMTKKK